MEGVSTVMPMTVKTGAGILASALLEGTRGGEGGNAAEGRARAAEAQAKRQAEAEVRSARGQVRELREAGQHKSASARVAAANSGLTLSGSSLLNLTALEAEGEERVDRVLGESALRVQSLLDSGAEQARSIRLSGRAANRGAGGRNGGLGSLLRLGSQSLGSW
jgi:hypothetical protein